MFCWNLLLLFSFFSSRNFQAPSTDRRKILHDALSFGPLTTKVSWLMSTYPSQLFWKTIFRPLGGAAPPNFYTRHRVTKSC